MDFRDPGWFYHTLKLSMVFVMTVDNIYVTDGGYRVRESTVVSDP